MSVEFINGLIDSRAKLVAQMRSLLEERATNGVFAESADEEQYQRINAEVSALSERIDELTTQEDRNRRYDEQREQYAKIVHPDAEAKQTESIADKFRNLKSGESLSFDLNTVRSIPADVNRAWEARDLTVGSGSGGGATVPTDFVRQLYEHMVEDAAIRQTNVNVITTNSGNSLVVPKTTSFGTAAIVGEGTAAAEADTAFGSVVLGSWRYARAIQVSDELLTDSGVDLLGFIAKEAGYSIGQATGAAFVTGTGTNSPNGFVTATKAQVGTSIQGTDTAILGTNLIDLFYAVNSKYANKGYWMMRRATEGQVRSIVDSNGQYLWQPGLQAGAPNLLLGRPVVNDPNMAARASAAASVAFGDFSAYTIRDVNQVQFKRSDDFAFTSSLVTFLVTLRTDGDLIDGTGAIKIMDTDG